MSLLDPVVAEKINVLRQRKAKAWRIFRCLSCALLILSILAVIFNLIQDNFLVLDPAPTKIDVPKALIGAISERSHGSGFSAVSYAFGDIQSQLSGLLEAMFPITAGLFVAVILFGVTKALVIGDMARAITSSVIGAITVAGLAFLPGMIGVTSDSSAPSPETDFIRMVELRDLDGVSKLLVEIDKMETPVGKYLLSQIALLDSKSNRYRISEAAASEIAKHSSEFSPSGPAMFAIDQAAYGKSVSKVAIEYESKINKLSKLSDLLSIALAAITAIVAIGTLLTGGLFAILQGRIGRIAQLTAPRNQILKNA